MKKLYSCITLTLALLTALAFRPTATDFLDQLKSGLQAYINLFPEKVFIHTDKPYYTSGEVIWFKAYLVHAASHEPLPISKLLYVELISPEDEILMKRYIKIEDGGGAGDFGLEPDLPSGTYRLKAYTNHMRNFGEAHFFQTPITIWSQNVDPREAVASTPPTSTETALSLKGPDLKVGFYPEGGDLVEGLKSMIAFKAVGKDGRGVDISGTVVDQKGNEITSFKTQGLGMGLFPLTPAKGEKYQVMVSYQGHEMAYPLPQALEEGYVMRASQRNDGTLNLRINTSPNLSVQDVTVVAHIRGILLGAINPREDLIDEFAGSFPLADVPDGVLTLTLFTKAGEPLAERLVFIDNPAREAQLDLQTDKTSYGKREKIQLDLDLKDPDGQPLASNLSISVTNQKLVDRKEEYSDLRTYLLLHSDLRGYIENAGYYFEKKDAARTYLLNVLMMTQGWRRFTWKEILNEEKPPLNYLVEQGFTVRGRITELNSDKAVQSMVWLNTFTQETMASYRFLTGNDGVFQFLNVDVPDTTEVIVQARKPSRKMMNAEGDLADNIPEKPKGNANVSIHPDPIPGPEVKPLTFLVKGTYEEQAIQQYVKESQNIRTVDSMYGGLSVQLTEVVVTARAPSRDQYKRPSMLYNVPSNRIIADSIQKRIMPVTIFDYLQFTPGLIVSGTGVFKQVSIRGGSNVLYLLDGLPIDLSVIQTINPWDVEFIDVLKGPAASIYGGQAGDGVIAIYTRIGPAENQEIARGPGVTNFTHPGYYKAREFYTPTYDEKKNQQKPDFRTTLFWDPLVSTNADGKAALSFFSSDDLGTFDIIVQGIAKTGYPVSEQFTLKIIE